MKNKVIFILLYLISLILTSIYIYIEFFYDIFNPIIKISILLIISVLTYLAGLFLVKYNRMYRNTIYKVNLLIWFILYLILIINLTFLDSYFSRRGFIIVNWNKIIIRDYFNYVINLIPFKVIIELTIGFINREISLKLFLINIFGNFFIFMPLSFFLPRLFKKENNLKTFIITMFIIISIIEISQFITLSGTFDIDDYILNIGGSYLMYKLLKKEKINNFIEKIMQY